MLPTIFEHKARHYTLHFFYAITKIKAMLMWIYSEYLLQQGRFILCFVCYVNSKMEIYFQIIIINAAF